MNAVLNSSMVDNPSLWRLSMMFSADGVDVFARCEVGEPECISAHLEADPAASSQSAAFEELIYANPLLLQPFRKTDIVVSGGFTLAVPSGTDLAEIDAIFPSDEASVTFSANIDPRNDLIFRLDRGVANFLRRTYDSVTPTHALAVLGTYFSRRSRIGNSSKMYVDLTKQAMNILIFNQIGLAMANGFSCSDINDAAYYALASANSAALDMSDDEIRISGSADRRAEIMPILRKFARNVMPTIFPTVAFGGDSSSLSAPFPLVILPLCE